MTFSFPVTEFPASPSWPRPPKAFRGPRGDVTSVRFADSPPFGNGPRKMTAAQKNGKRYERKVLSALASLWAGNKACKFLSAPWVEYHDNRNEPRFCQPDAILIEEWKVFIFEVKLSHTISAFWQLKHLYRPVIQAMFPTRAIALCEVTKSFDPSVLFPERFHLYFDPLQFVSYPQDLGVLQWKP